MTNTASYLVRQVIRHEHEMLDVNDEPVVYAKCLTDEQNGRKAAAIRYAVAFALRQWRNRANGKSTAKEEPFSLWNKFHAMDVFPAYMDVEDIIMEMMVTVVKSGEKFILKPEEEQEDFLHYLAEAMRNDVLLIRRHEFRHGQPYAISLDEEPPEENAGGYRPGDDHELEFDIAVTDPLKKVTEDVSVSVDATEYVGQFAQFLDGIDQMNGNNRLVTILLALMDDPNMTGEQLGALFDPPLSISTISRERQKLKRLLNAYDKEHMPSRIKILKALGYEKKARMEAEKKVRKC